MDTEGIYPHWKSALKEYREYINLRCGIEYVIWHGGYVVLTALAIVLLSGAWVLQKLRVPGAVDATIRFFNDPRVKRVGESLFIVLVIVIALVFLVIIAVSFVTAFWETLITAVFIFGAPLVILSVLMAFVTTIDYIREHTSTVHAPDVRRPQFSASEVPGLRRIWGACPVILTEPPKWFDNLTERFE